MTDNLAARIADAFQRQGVTMADIKDVQQALPGATIIEHRADENVVGRIEYGGGKRRWLGRNRLGTP